MRDRLAILGALIALLTIGVAAETASTAPAAAPSRGASFQGLGDLPGGTIESLALRVSADGSVVVGNGATASGQQAFRWTQREGMVSLGNLPDGGFKQSWAVGVSADGSVIVGYGDPDGSGNWDRHQGFRWTKGGGMALVGSLDGAARYEALGVSADGSVTVGDGGTQAFRWTPRGGAVGLGVLPGRTNSRAIGVSADGSVAVGSSYNLPSWSNEETFLWTSSGGMQALGYLPGGSTSFPNAISADGAVIAGTGSSSSGSAAFRWTRSTGMVPIGHLPGRKLTHPGGITVDGSTIVGASYVDRAHATAFIWDATHGTRSLQEVLETEYGLSTTGWNLQNASAITPDGSVIVGWGTNPAGQTEAFRVALATPSASTPTFVSDYLGETPPGDEPQVFGRGVVSVEGKNTHALQFSPDGRMLIFSRYPDKTSFQMMRGSDGWSQPERTSFTGKEVSFDARSKRLFYYDRGGELLWVRYGDDGFSTATSLNARINTAEAEYYPSITALGNLFFSRNSKWEQGRIMMAKPAGDDFAEPVDLGDLVNTGGASHGFVAPDESYLLFNSPRAGSHTKNDIWVSFRGKDGAWLAPTNLGPRINRDAMAVLCPTVSPDGKHLFFTRLQEGGTGLVYWVSAARILAPRGTNVPASYGAK
jgi:probable HAF family extracellular repeat protein